MKIKSVWFSADQSFPAYQVGKGGITQILILNDGNGPMGHYDVIYLWNDGEGSQPFAAMPAHQAHFWEYE